MLALVFALVLASLVKTRNMSYHRNMRTLLIIAMIVVYIAVLTKVADSKTKLGFCFKNYQKGKGCWKVFILRFESKPKRLTQEDCCRTHGGGWSRRKRERSKCSPCVTEKVVRSYWDDWGNWSNCNATCGVSYRERTRLCISEGADKPKCRGKGTKRKLCTTDPCPVDGGWSAWSNWSQCTVSCGSGHRLQRRSCTNPEAKFGGKECQGKLENWERCELQKHCPIDGGWGEWSSFGPCSKTCDLGTKQRSRKCDSPKPKYGGLPCSEIEAVGVDYCREERCGKTSTGCEGSGDCASGSGSGWEIGSGSGSGSSSGSGSGSGESSGEGGSGAWNWRKRTKSDDEDFN